MANRITLDELKSYMAEDAYRKAHPTRRARR